MTYKQKATLAFTFITAWILLWFGTAWLNLSIGVNLWYPPAGLTFGVLLLLGVRALPLPILAALIATLSLEQGDQWPQFLLAELLNPLGYALVALFLRHNTRNGQAARDLFGDPRQVMILLAGIGFGSLFSAVTMTQLNQAVGFLDGHQSWSDLMFELWLSEFIGAATFAPLTLILAVAPVQRLRAGQSPYPPSQVAKAPLRATPSLHQMGLTGVIPLALFWVLPHVWEQQLYPFMLLFLIPMLGWILAEQKIRATVLILFLCELGIVAMVLVFGQPELAFQYQLTMAALAASGLITGTLSHARLNSLARFRNFAEVSNDLLWEMDAEGRLLEVTGRLGGKILTRRHGQSGRTWRSYLVPRQPRASLDLLRNTLRSRGSFRQLVLRMRLSEGEDPVWTLTSALPRFDEEGEFLGYRGTTTDITQLKETEWALQRSRNELKQRVEQLARLASQLTSAEQRERQRLAKVLHDHLQQLLVAASLRLQLLRDNLEGAERGTAQEIATLLDRSITETKTLAVELSPPLLPETSLGAMLSWLAKRMEKTHGLSIRLTLDEGVSPQGEQVRMALFESTREALFNVVKHAKMRQAEVELTQLNRKDLVVIVRDQGIGIPPRAISDIEQPSSGLGLFAMRERLSLLGGTVEIESTSGRGTRIRLIAPIGAPPGVGARTKSSALRQATDPPAESAASPERAAGERDRLRILLVDDHALMRRGLSTLLAGEPDLCVIGESSNGLDAIELTERLRPDLILMDHSMPKMSGLEATRVIHELWPGIRIICLSMDDTPGAASAMLAAGATDYLCKTSGPAELLNKIRDQLG